MFPKLSSWFGNRRDALYIGEINEYLAQASNVTDLEQRIRVIEQRAAFFVDIRGREARKPPLTADFLQSLQPATTNPWRASAG